MKIIGIYGIWYHLDTISLFDGWRAALQRLFPQPLTRSNKLQLITCQCIHRLFGAEYAARQISLAWHFEIMTIPAAPLKMITTPRMITPPGKWPHVMTSPHNLFVQTHQCLQTAQTHKAFIDPMQMNNIRFGNGFPNGNIHTGFSMTKCKSNRFITFKSQEIQFFQCMQSKSPFAFQPTTGPQMKIPFPSVKHPMLAFYARQLIQSHTQSLRSHKCTTCR